MRKKKTGETQHKCWWGSLWKQCKSMWHPVLRCYLYLLSLYWTRPPSDNFGFCCTRNYPLLISLVDKQVFLIVFCRNVSQVIERWHFFNVSTFSVQNKDIVWNWIFKITAGDSFVLVWVFYVEPLLLRFSGSPFPFLSLHIEEIALSFVYLAPICCTARLFLNSSSSPLVANFQTTKNRLRSYICVLVDSSISPGVCRSQFCIVLKFP